MARIVRNIFLLLFAVILTFNVLYVTFAFVGSEAASEGLGQYFVPTRANFMGFEYWFDKFSTYPGLKNLLDTIRQTAQNMSGNGANGALDTIYEILGVIILPFRVFIAIIVDVINNVIWLFSLLDPYHNFSGF